MVLSKEGSAMTTMQKASAATIAAFKKQKAVNVRSAEGKSAPIEARRAASALLAARYR